MTKNFYCFAMNFWKNTGWNITRTIFAIAGILVLTSVLLGFFVHKNFFFFAGFIGFMEFFFALTGICPMAMILKKMGCQQ